MLTIPAIDLMDGAAVRLKQGRFDSATAFGDPATHLRAFAEAGATWVHIVDLDGARLGRPAQYALIERLAREGGVRIQCGGGVRERDHVARLLEAGVGRVVVGSRAVQKPLDVRAWLTSFGAEHICCAFDVRANEQGYSVAVHGWAADSNVSLQDALAFYPVGELKHILVTDVARDGVLAGPNVELIAQIARDRPDLGVQASGGIRDRADLSAVRNVGAAAAIVGRAFYDGRMSVGAALAG